MKIVKFDINIRVLITYKPNDKKWEIKRKRKEIIK